MFMTKRCITVYFKFLTFLNGHLTADIFLCWMSQTEKFIQILHAEIEKKGEKWEAKNSKEKGQKEN